MSTETNAPPTIECFGRHANITIDEHRICITDPRDVYALQYMLKPGSDTNRYTARAETATVIIVKIVGNNYAAAIKYDVDNIYTSIHTEV